MLTINHGQMVGEAIEFNVDTTYNLLYLMEAWDEYELEPPYQRGVAWTDWQQKALIESLIMRRPIPAIYVATHKAKTATNVKFNIVDGKQRLMSIRLFYNRKLKISVETDGVQSFLDYQELKQAHPTLAGNFANHSLTIIKYYDCDLTKQAELFDSINTFKQVTNEEYLAGTAFHLKYLVRHPEVKYALVTALQHTEAYKKKKEFKEYEHQAAIFMAKVLYLCYGVHLNDQYVHKALGIQKGNVISSNSKIGRFSEFCVNFHRKLANQYQNDEGYHGVSVDIPQVKAFIKACEIFENIVQQRKERTTYKCHTNDLFDVLVYIIRKLQIGFSSNDLSQFATANLELLCRFVKEKTEKMRHNSVTSSAIRDRQALLDRLSIELGIPSIPKQSTVSRSVRTDLINNAGICPLTADILHDGNIAIDHKIAKDNSELTAVSARGNIMKSNVDLEHAKHIVEHLSD